MSDTVPNRADIKEAIDVVFSVVYVAWKSSIEIDDSLYERLDAALDTIAAGIDGNASFNRHAVLLIDEVRRSGMLAVPHQKPNNAESILAQCEILRSGF